LAGDLAIFGFLWVAIDVEPNLLNGFPKLQAFYDHFLHCPKLASAIQDAPHQYFKRS
jgi:hypothetical protein